VDREIEEIREMTIGGVGRLQMVWRDVRWCGETPALLRWLGCASYAPLAGMRQLRSAGWGIRLVF